LVKKQNMRKVKFIMAPRQSGKTTFAIQELHRNPLTTAMACHSSDMSKYLKKKTGYTHNIFSQNEESKFLNDRVQTLILDEYMWFKDKDILYNRITGSMVKEIIVLSTSDKQYSKDLFLWVRKNKTGKNFHELLESYEGEMTKEIKKEIYDLYFNFFTDPDCKLTTFAPIGNREHLRRMMGEEKYSLEILNEYVI